MSADRRMSAFPRQRPFRGHPKASLRANRRHRRLLFDHPVRPREERFRDRQPKRLRRLEVDDKLELSRLLER